MTASCTTGWFDWIHRELWVCEDGLLLVRLDLQGTRAHGRGPTVSEPLRRREVEDRELVEIGDRRLSWIAAGDIAGASVRQGRLNGRLGLRLRDGTARKLLWLSADRADLPLLVALRGWGVAVDG